MMMNHWSSRPSNALLLPLLFGAIAEATAGAPVAAQGPGVEGAAWTYMGGDAWHTRYTPATQIDAANFESLEVAWRWDASSFGPSTARATPSYVDGKMITVTGENRHVIALDPSTGRLLWSFAEPMTWRHEYSMRKAYGKGVAYAEIDGRGVVYIISPGFFLYALDADTGRPLENWGEAVPLPGFPSTGTVDLVADLIEGWGSWENLNQEYDPDQGMPLEHETWENDAWQWTGDVSPWAPLSADPELGLVYLVTNGATIDYYGGFHPGDNLFGTSIVALDVETGERRWHFQFVHHDIWNYDTPTAPVLMDVVVDGRPVKGVFQATKQSWLYALDRETGEPIWPIEERPVPASKVPGEKLSPTQPHPTWPPPYDLQGRTEQDLIDYTPELREMALEYARENDLFAPLFNPPTHVGNPDGEGPALICPGGGGGANITGPPAAHPVNGLVFVPSTSGCSPVMVAPGIESELDGPDQTGVTHSEFSRATGVVTENTADQATVEGLRIWKGPVGRITAIDVNTGEHLWMIPHGDAPERQQAVIRDHPMLQGADVNPNQGRRGHSAMVATPTLLLASGQTSDGTPHLFAVDKRTGERVGQVELPGNTRYGMSSWVHEGKQYVIIQLTDGLAALALP